MRISVFEAPTIPDAILGNRHVDRGFTDSLSYAAVWAKTNHRRRNQPERGRLVHVNHARAGETAEHTHTYTLLNDDWYGTRPHSAGKLASFTASVAVCMNEHEV